MGKAIKNVVQLFSGGRKPRPGPSRGSTHGQLAARLMPARELLQRPHGRVRLYLQDRRIEGLLFSVVREPSSGYIRICFEHGEPLKLPPDFVLARLL